MNTQLPLRAAHSRPLRDPFADRASLLCRTLLSKPHEEWSVRGLAEAAGVAPMLSSDVVRQLAAAGIVTTRPAGRRLLVQLVNAPALLGQWTERYRWNRNATVTFAAPIADESRFLSRLPRVMGSRRWALTLLAGAWRRVRYTPTDRLHIYIESSHVAELRAIAQQQGWPEDATGRLVLMKPVYRTSVWHNLTRISGPDTPIVSDLQLVLDLWNYPERGRATAEQLWRPIARRLGPSAATESTAHQ